MSKIAADLLDMLQRRERAHAEAVARDDRDALLFRDAPQAQPSTRCRSTPRSPRIPTARISQSLFAMRMILAAGIRHIASCRLISDHSA